MSSGNCCRTTSGSKFVVFTVLIGVFIINVGNGQLINDYPEVVAPEPEVVHEPAGAFIKLKCELNPCKKGSNILKWEYKVFNEDFLEKQDCEENSKSKWMNIKGYRNVDQCTSIFIIKKATGNNSGIYKCSYQGTTFDEFKTIQLYHVHVIEPYNIRNGTKPKLLDIDPLNITIIENLRIVVQCKVYSDFIIPPEIWWLKHVDSSDSDNKPSLIHYSQNNKTYLKLNSSQMALANNIYVSKLIIEKSSKKDTGAYTCLALNFYGKSNKEIYIDVLVSNRDWQGTSFLILFLIPLSFALIPISGWLFVYYYRKKKSRKLQQQKEVYEYQLMLNRNNLNRLDRIFSSPI